MAITEQQQPNFIPPSQPGPVDEYLQGVYESLGLGVLRISAAGDILSANARAEQLLGASIPLTGPLLASPAWQWICADGSPCAESQHPFARALANRGSLAEVELGLKDSPGGRPAWFKVTAQPEFAPAADQPARFYLLFRDISAERSTQHRLKERVKELNAVYAIAEIVETRGTTPAEQYQRIADVLPNSWQYPDFTCARLLIFDADYRTSNYRATPWTLSAPISVMGMPAGRVEVAYLVEYPPEDEGCFLKEERLLIDAVAERVGRIVERRMIQAELQHKNELFELAIQTSNLGIWRQDYLHNTMDLDAIARRHFGFGPEPLTEKDLLERIHPDDLPMFTAEYQAALQEGEVGTICTEHRVIHPDGTLKWLSAHARITFTQTESGPLPTSAVGTFEDITERKLAEETLKNKARALYVLSAGNQSLLRIGNEPDLLREICRVCVEDGGYHMAWVGLVEHDAAKTVRPAAQFGFEDGYLQTVNITWADTERGRGPTGTAVRTHRPIISQNILDDPQMAPWRAAALQRGFRSNIAIPIDVDGETVGVITIYAREPFAFKPDEVELLVELTNDMGYGITTLRTRERQKQLEEKLIQSEGRYRLAQQAARIGSWEWDSRTNLESWSDEMYLLFDMQPGERVHNQPTVFARVVPEDKPRVQQAFPDAFASGTFDFEFRIHDSTGQIRWLNCKGSVLKDAAGKPVSAVGTMLDVTHRRQAEEALQRVLRNYEWISSNAEDVIWVMDVQTRQFVFVSPSVQKLRGYSPDEVLQQTLEQSLTPASAAAAGALLSQSIPDFLQGKPQPLKTIELEQIRKDGSIVVTEVSARLAFDDAGHLQAIGITRDVTERKRVEERLRVSNETNQAIINATLESVILIDPTGMILAANPTGAKRLNTSPEGMVGKNLFDYIPADISEFRRGKLAELVSTRQPVIFEDTRGGIRFQLSCYPVFQPDGAVGSVVVFARDITEAYQVQEAVRRHEQMQRAFLEAVTESVLLINPDGTGIMANTKTLERLHLTAEQFTGHNIFKALPPEVEAFRREQAAWVVKNRKAVQFEDVRFGRHILNSINPVIDAAGNVVQLAIFGFDITEQKIAQEQLAVSERRNKIIVEAIPDLLFRVKRDGMFLDYHAPSINKLYAPPDAFMGKKIADVLPPEVVRQAVAAIDAAFHHGSLQTFEYSMALNPTVNPGHYEGRVVANLESDEAVIIVRDITDQRQTELDLRRSEEKYRLLSSELEQRVKFRTAEIQDLYDNAPTGYHSFDRSGTITMMNQTELRWLGYTSDEVVGKKTIYDIITPESAAVMRRADPASLKNGPLNNLEYDLVRKNGTLLPAVSNVVAYYDSDGLFSHSRWTVIDNSERKLIEAEIRRINNLSDTALELAKAGYWYMPIDGSGTYFSSDRVIAIHGDPHHADNRYDLDKEWLKNVRLANSELAALASQSINAVLAGREDVHDVEYQYMRPLDGQIIWIHAIGHLVRDANGKPVAVSGVSQDISQQKQLLEELSRAKEAAEAANRAKSTFLANMSHEIRTPMNAILGFTQIILRDPQIESKNRNYVEIIHRSGEHLLTLINEILEMSKIEAGHVSFNPLAFNLHLLLKDILSMFHPRLEAKNLSMTLDLQPDLPEYIITDENKLKEILINIIGNAIKFTTTGGITLRCWSEADPTQANPRIFSLHLDVEDTGVGISAQDSEKLFQPFMQTLNGAQKIGGTGLGLAISQNHARLMGGEITVTSIPNQGSCFHIRLTVECTEQVPPSNSAPHRQVTGLQPGTREMKILVVDDHLENRLVLKELLEPLGIRTQDARDGAEAVTAAQEWKPDLILMDLRMPVLNGFEAARQIKASDFGKDIPIVALTASILELDRDKVDASGMTGYIRKPFKAYDLFAMLEAKLGPIFVYDGGAPELEPAPSASDPSVEPLSILPQDLIHRMYSAALNAQIDQLLDLIDMTASYAPQLASKLRGLAAAYQYDALLKIFADTTGQDD